MKKVDSVILSGEEGCHATLNSCYAQVKVNVQKDIDTGEVTISFGLFNRHGEETENCLTISKEYLTELLEGDIIDVLEKHEV